MDNVAGFVSFQKMQSWTLIDFFFCYNTIEKCTHALKLQFTSLLILKQCQRTTNQLNACVYTNDCYWLPKDVALGEKTSSFFKYDIYKGSRLYFVFLVYKYQCKYSFIFQIRLKQKSKPEMLEYVMFVGQIILAIFYGTIGTFMTMLLFITAGPKKFFRRVQRPSLPAVATDPIFGKHGVLVLKVMHKNSKFCLFIQAFIML